MYEIHDSYGYLLRFSDEDLNESFEQAKWTIQAKDPDREYVAGDWYEAVAIRKMFHYDSSTFDWCEPSEGVTKIGFVLDRVRFQAREEGNGLEWDVIRNDEDIQD